MIEPQVQAEKLWMLEYLNKLSIKNKWLIEQQKGPETETRKQIWRWSCETHNRSPKAPTRNWGQETEHKDIRNRWGLAGPTQRKGRINWIKQELSLNWGASSSEGLLCYREGCPDSMTPLFVNHKCVCPLPIYFRLLLLLFSASWLLCDRTVNKSECLFVQIHSHSLLVFAVDKWLGPRRLVRLGPSKDTAYELGHTQGITKS